MGFDHLLKDPCDENYNKLSRARLVLSGRDADGNRVHPSMFDDGVISFAHGEGLRRPHPSVVSAGIKALIDTKKSSLENYLFMQRLGQFDDLIQQRFIKIGVPKTS